MVSKMTQTDTTIHSATPTNTTAQNPRLIDNAGFFNTKMEAKQ